MVTSSSSSAPLSATTVFLMALACAFAVSTLYYNQPLLASMGATFGRSDAQAGQIAMLTQLGYASGLFLLVPLGDRVDRKRLIIALLACNMVSLLAVGVAPNFNLLKLASFAVGASAVSAQIIIPTMSGLVDPTLRGRVVGTLLSGLSAGLLFARTLSGFVGASEGWRMMFLLAVAIDVLVMVVIFLRFPSTAQATSLPYTALLSSLWALFKGEPTVRAACATGFLMFAAFCALWSTLAMLMARPPYEFGPDAVGAFGSVGIAGLLASPAIGRAVDRVGSGKMLFAGALLLVAAFALVGVGASHLWLLIVAMATIDIGNRAGLVANQSRITALSATARSRLNTLFMTSYFLGGATGTAVAATTSASLGWHGLALTGALFAVTALCAHLLISTSTPSHR
ncbi:MFS transporter [Kluyvera sp. Nf5]|jgi:predicted MFS family arabinose efflux permease|nr:MFS transporter [Kluyvera sp. Nf5]